MGPPKEEQLKNTAATNDGITKAGRAPTNLAASRKYSPERAHSMPQPSRVYEEPQTASEPPKVLMGSDIHPTTQSTRSTSAGARKKTDATTTQSTRSTSVGARKKTDATTTQSTRSTSVGARKKTDATTTQSTRSTSVGARKKTDATTTQSTRSTSVGARKKTDASQCATTSTANPKSLPQEASSLTRMKSEVAAQSQWSQKDTERIESQTRGQRNNPDWHHWRQNRITASLAHQISHSRFVNQKTNEIPQSYLKNVLATGSRVQTAAMSWGIKNEKYAVLNYEKQALKNKGREVKVEECGLFIHPTKNWLAASPDGIVKDKITGEKLCILEAKCPYKHKDHTIREACADRNFCLALNGDSYVLKSNHAYYTQVQCQLASTGMRNADFVVYTNKETVVVPLEFNPEFWEETEPKLERFYKDAVVPQIKKQNTTAKEEQKYDIHAPEE